MRSEADSVASTAAGLAALLATSPSTPASTTAGLRSAATHQRASRSTSLASLIKMAEMDYRLIQKGDKPFYRLSQGTVEQVEVIEQLGDTYTIKLLDGTTKMRIPSCSLLLFELNALVTVEIKRNGQIVHCLAKIQDTIETWTQSRLAIIDLSKVRHKR